MHMFDSVVMLSHPHVLSFRTALTRKSIKTASLLGNIIISPYVSFYFFYSFYHYSTVIYVPNYIQLLDALLCMFHKQKYFFNSIFNYLKNVILIKIDKTHRLLVITHFHLFLFMCIYLGINQLVSVFKLLSSDAH